MTWWRLPATPMLKGADVASACSHTLWKDKNNYHCCEKSSSRHKLLAKLLTRFSAPLISTFCSCYAKLTLKRTIPATLQRTVQTIYYYTKLIRVPLKSTPYWAFTGCLTSTMWLSLQYKSTSPVSKYSNALVARQMAEMKSQQDLQQHIYHYGNCLQCRLFCSMASSAL